MGKLKYVEYLDGTRGVLCLLIMAYHWPMKYLSISLGWEVLQAFYVFSGYLIARILIHQKEKNAPFKYYYGRFWFRRAFRIFPLYYAFVLFWVIVHFAGVLVNSQFIVDSTEEVQRNGFFISTYLYNFMTYFNFLKGINYDSSFIFGHLWSLSLEEHFYLIFPLIVFICSKKQLLYGSIFLVIFVPVLRYFGHDWLFSINDDPKWVAETIYRNTFFQMDSFAIGCVLAITGFKWIKRTLWAFYGFLFFTVAVYLFLRYQAAMDGLHLKEILSAKGLHFWLLSYHQYVYILTIVNFQIALLCMSFERGFGIIPFLFKNKLMEYLGKISYGMYTFHVPILFFWLVFYSRIVPIWIHTKYPFLYELAAWVPYMTIVVVFSHLSYYYYESYFLTLKDKRDKRKEYRKLAEK